ncbi:hypothetical protein [Chromobacterium violaceum]|uniref:hypothetical protein n=1 Tax=Chromobacterium violaceum TaxID=536 RepID=UPI0012D4866E|nr:hypothetical protein [Chromobacterium violaceum]
MKVIDLLQTAHDKYFDLLLKNYPTLSSKAPFEGFGPPELCELAIEAHSCAIALGPAIRERLFYLGFDILYPFDNPVDLYGWHSYVKENNVAHSVYASIAIRIDSELKRIRRVFVLSRGAAYDAVPPDIFLVSKERYRSAIKPKSTDELNEYPNTPDQGSVSIHTVNIQYTNDSQAIDRLKDLESKTTIWSNFSNVVGVLRSIFIG